MDPTESVVEEQCYCSSKELDLYMLTCSSCKKKFHLNCLKTGRPSSLAGDIYFTLTCQTCAPGGIEIVKRMKLQWTLVVMLALYNLQLEGKGKCGFYRWREHICSFIDKHWSSIFDDRKKSATWHGTVAGALSTGTNRFFLSGFEALNETGYWSLKSGRLPAIDELDAIALNIKSNRKRKGSEPEQIVVEGCRRKNTNVVEAAVALKERKSMIDMYEAKPFKIKKKRIDNKLKTDLSIFPPNHKLKFIVDSSLSPSQQSDDSSNQSFSKFAYKADQSRPSSSSLFDNLNFGSQESEIDLDMPDMYDIDMLNSFDVPDSFLEDMPDVSMNAMPVIKQECESDEENTGGKIVGTPKKAFPDVSRKRTVVTKEESPVKEVTVLESQFVLMSVYEEEILLQKLEKCPVAMKENPQVRQLYRKLKVRKLKRERNIPVFDLDTEMRLLRGMDPPEYSNNVTNTVTDAPVNHIKTIFDRFQASANSMMYKSTEPMTFIARLMGKNVEQLESIVSPYSGRVLKPFIFRDYRTKPLKLQLLEEILIRANKNNKDWVPPERHPIDYCYVRPEFIPSINMLCHEFFWPGIDMQECLQYPDFSCVALYRKVIVGFAFMVPDAKYNEAYITFIFCHPEWRKCGIATFMLYHLIQTCMGKDITLHVSATSSAVFLYQKFCFKIEEIVHDFYDKYLPADSKECRHALFLRLSR